MNTPDTSEKQPNIVICWELGGGLGHLVKGAMLARLLLERDCTVSFAVRDLASAHPLLPEENYCLVQAPYFDGQLRDWAPPADYAELLLHAGWGEAGGLRARVRGWRGLYDALNTDLVIADHAPTAILAARTQGIPTVQWGHGFGMPTRPWPVFRTWEATPVERLAQVRRHILTSVNTVLNHFGEAGLDAPEQLLETAACFLNTWPELDHYPGRGNADYCGPLWPAGIGEPPWQGESNRPRIFAYLRPNLPGLPAVIQALAALDADILIHLADRSGLDLPAALPSHLRFTDRLIDIHAVARNADLVLCSGTDTLHGMAVRGIPTLALPMNAEQRMGAERLLAIGAGLCLVPSATPDFLAAVADALDQLLHQPAFRQNASRLQSAYENRDSDAALAAIADRCVALAAG